MSVYESAMPADGMPAARHAKISARPASRAVIDRLRDFTRPRKKSPAEVSKKLRIMESNDAARAMFNTLLENCIFYISPMYEFLHMGVIPGSSHTPALGIALQESTRPTSWSVGTRSRRLFLVVQPEKA
jgi:hypothetical protein